MSISPTTGLFGPNLLNTGQVGNVPLQPPVAELDRFQQALERAGYVTKAAQIDPPIRVAQLADAATVTDATDPVQAAGAAQRAVQGLQLSPDSDGTAGTGTSILQGLGQLRSIFDGELSEIARASNTIDPMNSAGLMRLQAQLVEFSLVVDVTSKLAGKSTQALDSLMKGQ